MLFLKKRVISILNIIILIMNGVGFPKDFDYENTDSLGLTVIKSLTSQINGEFIIVPDNGAHYQVSFPIK
jgi:two-component sensor histidine kinase